MNAAGRTYLLIAAMACLAAAIQGVFFAGGQLPVLGSIPLLPATLVAAAAGWLLLQILHRKGIGVSAPVRFNPLHFIAIVVLGAILALPPVIIDLIAPFSPDMNLPLPGALFFYPAIALVAEVVFHLLPLAILAALLPRGTPALWLMAPVVLIEPLFQALFVQGPPLQSWLVIGNVGLISATQIWLFQKYGFAAMIGLRLSFYLFWHVIWGTARLPLLF